MSEIVDGKIRKILDSRGNPTLEVEIYTAFGKGISAAPSGASKGATEVKDYPLNGGIDASIKLFHSKVLKSLKGVESTNQEEVDRTLEEIDGSKDFSVIGGNLAVSISMANAFAASNELGIPLFRYLGGVNYGMPIPLGNVVGGGAHALNGTTIQEFLVASHSDDVFEAIHSNSLVHKKIKELASKEIQTPIGMGDEKAWVLPFDDVKVIDIISEAVSSVSDSVKLKIEKGIDLAASNFYKDGKYQYRNRKLSKEEQVSFVESIVKDHGFTVIEDPFDENDYESYAELTRRVGNRAMIIGDDLYTTDYDRLKKGIELRATNAILLKPNQVGTVSRLMKTWKLAKANCMGAVVSHRSGETDDFFISHLAVAIGSNYIKTGTVGGERIAKLNELVRIQEEIGVIR